MRSDFPLDYYGAHRPFHDDDAHKPSWTDGSGRQVIGPFRKRVNKRRIRAFPAKGARQFATLNHYALRSLDSYLVKNDRGDVNREHRAFDDTYWRERNDNAYFDDSVLRYEDAVRAEMDRLRALDGVGALHEAAVSAHRDKCRVLLKQHPYRAMRQQLRDAPRFASVEQDIRSELGLT